MVGIGGIGMQALADVLLAIGHQITGSDIVEFSGKVRLIQKGAKVIIGPQVAGNVPDNIDGLIYTSAILHHQKNHAEVEQAKQLNVPVWKRSEFIGELMKSKYSIAVSGTHGKTTTSTLLTLMLQAGGLDPTALIGAEVKSLTGCGILGKSKYMVVEACEYDRAFLDMVPTVAVLTSIEADHLDYYQDLAEIKQAFIEFLNKVPVDGYVVVYGDDPNIQAILPQVKPHIITFGFGENNDVRLSDISYDNDRMHFTIDNLSGYMHFPGRHLVLDAAAAMIVARQLGVSDDTIKQVLEQDFKGANRRFEILGTYNGVTFVDDYGHHPTEIKMALAAAKDFFSGRRIIVIFQAHQYSRTRLLLDDFAVSFADADQVWLAPILAVRDSAEDIASINAGVLAQRINQHSHNARVFSDFPTISQKLPLELNPGDVVISMGAGHNSEWVHEFISQYQ
ncbi:MAG: UDP-N-acetylmuramate--L-alanine ligase [Patescibacteria group bacterium]